MGTEESEARRTEALARVLAAPRTALVALAADGTRVELPVAVAATAAAGHGVRGRGMHLDTVLPEDRGALISAWESACRSGTGTGVLRLKTSPDQRWELTIVDARPEHGVLLSAVSPVDGGHGEGQGAHRRATGRADRRPRTGTMTKSTTATIVAADDRCLAMLGLTADAVVGRRSLELLHPEDHERAISGWLEIFSAADTQRVRMRHLRGDGSWLWVEVDSVLLPDPDPARSLVLCQLTDISDEMAAHEALARQERLLHRLTESLPLGIAQLDEDLRVVHANSRLAQLLGRPALHRDVDLRTALPAAARGALQAVLDGSAATGQDAALEVVVPGGAEAGPRTWAMSIVRLDDAGGTAGCLVCVADVTDSARMRAELTVRATYDALTGCHNRASTLAALDLALRQDAGLPTASAVVFLDLDRFKPVNDRWGHAVGDELLVEVARRLTAVLRHGDVVGRLGGDEFLVVSRGIDSAEGAAALGRRVREALVGPARLSIGDVELHASIGVALASPGESSEALVTRADRAMYRSKQQAGCRPVLAAALTV